MVLFKTVLFIYMGSFLYLKNQYGTVEEHKCQQYDKRGPQVIVLNVICCLSCDLRNYLYKFLDVNTSKIMQARKFAVYQVLIFSIGIIFMYIYILVLMAFVFFCSTILILQIQKTAHPRSTYVLVCTYVRMNIVVIVKLHPPQNMSLYSENKNKKIKMRDDRVSRGTI